MIGKSFQALDRILRGEGTSPEAIQSGEIQFPLAGFCVVGIALAMVYGFCMGMFSLFRDVSPSIGHRDQYLQVLAAMVKVPALFFLTLLITTPSLYVFNALVGSRLRARAMMRLLMAAMGVNLAVLASLGPIVAFFSVSTPSYDFMLLFNVAVFGISGMLGLLFLIQTLNRLSSTNTFTAPTELSPVGDDESTPQGSHSTELTEPTEHSTTPAAIDTIPGQVMGQHVKLVFRCWVLLYGLVGAQMGWVLRPFLGNPELPFTWFRGRQSNFFEAVLHTLGRLIGH
ncbi:MAG: hypothetical protein KDA92_04150 [Planctomycetales bacterium]|nr:hypothetical protein [Planctomycetales bacterium]